MNGCRRPPRGWWLPPRAVRSRAARDVIVFGEEFPTHLAPRRRAGVGHGQRRSPRRPYVSPSSRTSGTPRPTTMTCSRMVATATTLPTKSDDRSKPSWRHGHTDAEGRGCWRPQRAPAVDRGEDPHQARVKRACGACAWLNRRSSSRGRTAYCRPSDAACSALVSPGRLLLALRLQVVVDEDDARTGADSVARDPRPRHSLEAPEQHCHAPALALGEERGVTTSAPELVLE